MRRAARVFRHPSLHFLALGALCFLLHRGVSATPRAPVVALAASDRATFPQCTADAATDSARAEREARCQAEVDEEILVREAIRLGIDATDPVVRRRAEANAEFLEARDARARRAMVRRDPVVRRRLVQRMRQHLAAIGTIPEPRKEELLAVIERDPERFRRPARIRFSQVFVANGTSMSERVARIGRALTETLLPSEATAVLGDPFLVGVGDVPQSLDQVARKVGDELATKIFLLPKGVWSPPLRSPYGTHFVWVHEILPAEPRPATEIEDEARRLLEAATRERAAQTALADLRRRYAGLEPDAPTSRYGGVGE